MPKHGLQDSILSWFANILVLQHHYGVTTLSSQKNPTLTCPNHKTKLEVYTKFMFNMQHFRVTKTLIIQTNAMI